MLYGLPSSLTLPELKGVAHLESKGNYAIKRYYQWPFSFFYQHKLKMVLDLMDKPYYHNILDFGAGPGIFNETLKRKATHVVEYDIDKPIKEHSSFELIICASVLEFIQFLDGQCKILNKKLTNGGKIIVASPMNTLATRTYFNLIGDKHKRNSHETILSTLSQNFFLEEYHTWLGIYFSARLRKL